MNTFVTACGDNDIDTVMELIDMVDVNDGDSDGNTGLMVAMGRNNLVIASLLLDHPSIVLCKTNKENKTALHSACSVNNIECVRLFLVHYKCSMDIVTIQSRDGITSEMAATMAGARECAWLIRQYLTVSAGKKKKKLKNILKRFCGQDEQLLAPDLDTMELEETDTQRRKETFKAEPNRRIQNKFPEQASSPPAKYIPLLSLIPECPACYEKMRPPRQIYNCANGHLICSDCKPLFNCLTDNYCVHHCGSMYTGRAIAMEQVIRQILGIM